MRYLGVILFVVITTLSLAQENYPKEDFRSPLDIPLYLSGTFGEPRSTHFHAGLDLKTQGVEGLNIYSIGDGYISRIKVSAWGYGNTLYVTHTNGYTSVYAHLKSFNEDIAKWIKERQIAETSFEINLDSLDRTLFLVNKGDVIAKSGNTGGSHGPHLHFEIRDSLERPINPFLFGFDIKVKDKIKPGLYNLVLYNLSSDRYFTKSNNIKLSGSNGQYSLSETVKVNRDAIGFGINTTDKFSEMHNHNGVYDIKMYLDGEMMYHYQMNRFSFDEAKYVLTHCDYWRKRKYSQTVHKCFVEPGNKMDSYNYLNNNAYVYLHDNFEHNVVIEVSDFHGNESKLSLKVQKDANSAFFNTSEQVFHEVLVQGRANSFESQNVNLIMKDNVIFDDVYLKVKKEEKTPISDGFHIGDFKTPVFTAFQVKIPAKNIIKELSDKYLIVYKNYKNSTRALGGVYNAETNSITTESKSFGYYYITIDTIPPKISPVNIYSGKTLTNHSKIQFKIRDNLSGIEEYNCFINGQWVVLELDGKKALFTYYIDENVVKGDNNIVVVATDERENASVYRAKFIY